MQLPDWETLSANTRAAVTAVVIALIVSLTIVVVAVLHRPQAISAQLTHSATSLQPSSSADPWGATASTSATVTVDVEGKVRRPGLETLPTGKRVADAITAAGGALPGASTSGLNLASKLVDGEQIVVGAPAPAATGGSAAATGPVNLNTATLTDLESLPGVGPVMAQRILDWRTAHGQFATVDQLREVQGIGDVTFSHLKDLVTV